MNILPNSPEECCRALGDGTRLRLVRLLAASNDEACLCEFQASLDEPGYKLSRHLKILRDAGLLVGEKDGRWVYHRLVSEPDFVKHLWAFVLAVPDRDGVFEQDLKRFKENMNCRTDGRCRKNDEQSTSKLGSYRSNLARNE
jgi:ArsR family transcriptional regulator